MMERRQSIFRHAGYEMRSHAEQRWAGIMDVLNVRWLYEAKTIKTRHGWYMPDFYLPACGAFIEVKGPTPSKEEIEKAKDAEAATGCPVIFAYGDPEYMHGELFHGLLAYYGQAGVMDLPTTELGEMISKIYGKHTYWDYVAAGARKQRPDVVQLGEAMIEVITGMLTRDENEKRKRAIHEPLNSAKADAIGPHSFAEWFVAKFVDFAQRKRKEAA